MLDAGGDRSKMVADFVGSIAAGFLVGILSWTAIFTAAVHTGATRYRRLSPVIAYAPAAIMAAFGLLFLGLRPLTTIL